eukprot:6795565-Pyramimonas_sp.AAC.1
MEPTAAPQPADVLQQIWAQHRDRDTGLSPVAPPGEVLAACQVAGLDNLILETPRALHEQGAVRLGPEHATGDIAGGVGVEEATEIDFAQQAGVVPQGEQAANTSEGGRSTPLHLVPLFDGRGLARLAIGDLVHKLGASHRFMSSVFAEHNREAAEAVARR